MSATETTINTLNMKVPLWLLLLLSGASIFSPLVANAVNPTIDSNDDNNTNIQLAEYRIQQLETKIDEVSSKLDNLILEVNKLTR